MDLEGHTLKAIDIGKYRHNYEGFCENFTYLMSINKKIMTTTQGALISIIKTLTSSPSLLVKRIKEVL